MLYIVTQGELDELRSRLEGYKDILDSRDAIKEAVDALSAAFDQVAVAVAAEEILKGFSDWYLEIIGDAYKPRPKPKRPQRKIFLRSRIIDHRACIYSLLPKRRSV